MTIGLHFLQAPPSCLSSIITRNYRVFAIDATLLLYADSKKPASADYFIRFLIFIDFHSPLKRISCWPVKCKSVLMLYFAVCIILYCIYCYFATVQLQEITQHTVITVFGARYRPINLDSASH